MDTVTDFEVPPPPSPVEVMVAHSSNSDTKIIEDQTTTEVPTPALRVPCHNTTEVSTSEEMTTVTDRNKQSKEEEDEPDTDDEITFLSSKKTSMSSDSDDMLS